MKTLNGLLRVAGLAGLLQGTVKAGDKEGDTGINRSGYTFSQARKEMLDRAVHVNYDNWQREVANYDGAIIVLFSTGCIQNDIIRNMDLVYLGLIDQFENSEVNGEPLKFGFYDACGKSKADLLGVDDNLQTHMYLDGRLVDKRTDGIDPTKIDGNVKAMSAWIDSTLLGNTRVTDYGRPYRWGYENTSEVHKIFLDQ